MYGRCLLQRQEEEARAVDAEKALKKKIEVRPSAHERLSGANAVWAGLQAAADPEGQLGPRAHSVPGQPRRVAPGQQEAHLRSVPTLRLVLSCADADCADVELVASRAAGSAPAAAKLAQEKTALERKVEQLAADLRRSEATLERAQSTVASGGNEVRPQSRAHLPQLGFELTDPRCQRSNASAASSKLAALDDEVTRLKAENARLVAQAKPVRLPSANPLERSH